MSGERRSGVDRKKERLRALLHLAAQDTEAAKLLAAHEVPTDLRQGCRASARDPDGEPIDLG